MIVVRPVKKEDLPQFISLASQAGINLYTLPHDPKLLEERLNHSLASFAANVSSPGDELYLFALVEREDQTLLGIAGLVATTGGEDPLYFFRLEAETLSSTDPAIVTERPLLTPISYVRGPSELCSLFLLPHFREKGLGRLLSLSRFMFMAAFPQRFTDSLFAELRGVVYNDDTSPFWDGIGNHFLNISFAEAISRLKNGRSFIPEFLPKHPIYTALLNPEVQASIGKTHPQTRPALAMLQSEGMFVSDEIDVFDGGPKLRGFKSQIRAINASSVYQVAQIAEELPSTNTYILSNDQTAFRACLGAVDLFEGNLVAITTEVAVALHIGIGSPLRIVPLHSEERL